VKRLLISALALSSVAAPAVAIAAAPDGISNKSDDSTKLVAAREQTATRRDDVAARHARKRAKRHAAKQAAAGGSASPTLQAIAACESGGNPSAIGGGGQFRGKYQFDESTWQSVGGTGDPAAAPVAEQDRRAAMLYAREGSTPWPVCGR
jgi:Ni/Co efflux regulator RcnB